jgi:hypothetical protein
MFRKDPAMEAMSDGGGPPPIVVIQAQPPTVQLGLQKAVCFPQTLDDVALFQFEPIEQHCDDQAQRNHPRVYVKLDGCSFRTLRARPRAPPRLDCGVSRA